MLRFDHVTYRYPFQSRPAVNDISFSVRPGELVLCTGPSGCGKSTLIRLANGLCPKYYRGALEGKVTLGGDSTAALSLPDIARRMGSLFQDPEQQFFALNVEDDLAFALEWRGMAPEDIRAGIMRKAGKLGITHILDSAIHELSEGQKQKVGLTSLLLQDPPALVLDEPTANLDPESTRDLADMLLKLKESGLAILVVDHRLYWLDGVADRVMVMRGGRVAEEGDFSLLRDAALRETCGLRADRVSDPRTTLPPAAFPAAPVLEAKNLRFGWKESSLLYDGASFGLDSGVVALIGDNGTGKTTLARLLSGLNKPLDGAFFADGRELSPRELAAKTGVVLQNADYQLHMKSVRAEIECCLALAGRGREETARLLGMFALEELAERHPQSLSGGEKQRLVIACAFAKHPGVLILDEPTSGLDGLNMRRIADALEDVAAQGVCALVITHDLELMERACSSALRLPFPAARDTGSPAGLPRPVP